MDVGFLPKDINTKSAFMGTFLNKSEKEDAFTYLIRFIAEYGIGWQFVAAKFVEVKTAEGVRYCPKNRLKDLESWGVIKSVGAGRYSVTLKAIADLEKYVIPAA